MIAGPTGGLISFWLGRRWAIRTGEASRRVAVRHMLHWVGMGATIFMDRGPEIARPPLLSDIPV